MQIRMTEHESLLFKAFVQKASGYFEFGIGGSTIYAAATVLGPLVAVESDTIWIAKVSKCLERNLYARKLIHVDIGKTGEWGYPVDGERKADFPRYPSSIIGQDQVIDLCLVDGRFRVACFLQALKHLRADAIIGIHDFASRPFYHPILEFAREIAVSEDLSFFVRRRWVNMSRLEETLAAHIDDPK